MAKKHKDDGSGNQITGHCLGTSLGNEKSESSQKRQNPFTSPALTVCEGDLYSSSFPERDSWLESQNPN